MIRVFEPKIYITDLISVIKTMLKSNVSGTSPTVGEFENLISMKFNRKYGVAVSNGSVALDLALQQLNLKENDEVILPSFTIVSCLSAVIRTGAKPVFCDVNKKSWNMTKADIEKVFTKNTKAVIMVHTYGLPSDASEILDFCKANKLTLIEDAAEAHGQKENNKLCGSFGDMSTFSFYANKHITTGEGGIVLTDDEGFYKNLKQMRNLDFENSKRFNHDNFYWNYRLSGLQAALGISQLNKLEKTIKLKINQGKYYLELLSDYQSLFELPPSKFDGVENHFWVFGVVLKKDNIRDKLMIELANNNIETRPFFWPLHLQNALSEEHKNGQAPLTVSEYLGKNGLYLPMGNHINKKVQKLVVQNLLKAHNNVG